MDEAYRSLSFAQKLARVGQLNAMVREIAMVRIAALHPQETEREHRIRLLLLSTPRDVVDRLLGPLPKAV